MRVLVVGAGGVGAAGAPRDRRRARALGRLRPLRRRRALRRDQHDRRWPPTYLYHAVDNEHSMREWGHQAVVLQTALDPVVALELLAAGAWEGAGVLGPESFPPSPFLDLLADYGAPHATEDR